MPRKEKDGKATPPPTFRPGEREPPHAPEAERGLLGALLVDSEVIAVAVDFVRPEDFFHPAHQKIMDVMFHLFDRGQGIDVVTVTDELRNRGELDAIGGPQYLARLVTEAASSASIEYYANIVRDKAAVRNMIATASAIVSEGYAAELEAREFLDRAEARLFAAGEMRLYRNVRRLRDVISDAVDRIEAQRERHEHVTGVPTGYPRLDQMLLGFQPSDLVIVAARPSMGKTSFALNLALNAARDHGRAVLFSSLEMSEAQLANRILCLHTGIASNRLRGGFISASDMERLKDAREQLESIPLFIDDTPKRTVFELHGLGRRMKYRHQLDMVIVDYLQLIQPAEKLVSREQQISEISRSLKSMAKELDVPVVALSQLSRAPENRPDKRPILSDLRESGAIEQDADVVMFLYRPEYYERNEEKREKVKGKLEVIIAKQRNGPTGTVGLYFIPETMQIAIPADEYEQEGFGP